MGLFWDLYQQSHLGKHDSQVSSLEGRVANLERELKHTQALLRETLKVLEEVSNRDLDGDGIVGK